MQFTLYTLHCYGVLYLSCCCVLLCSLFSVIKVRPSSLTISKSWKPLLHMLSPQCSKGQKLELWACTAMSLSGCLASWLSKRCYLWETGQVQTTYTKCNTRRYSIYNILVTLREYLYTRNNIISKSAQPPELYNVTLITLQWNSLSLI